MALIDQIRLKNVNIDKILQGPSSVNLPADGPMLWSFIVGGTLVWFTSCICCAACMRQQSPFSENQAPGHRTVQYTAVYTQPTVTVAGTESQLYPGLASTESPVLTRNLSERLNTDYAQLKPSAPAQLCHQSPMKSTNTLSTINEVVTLEPNGTTD